MPLPCSPVSNSTASEASGHTSEDTDDSLTTPRPGPAEESQRTASNLSRPSLPPFSTSPANRSRDAVTWSAHAQTASTDDEWHIFGRSADSISTATGRAEAGASSGSYDRKRSITFSPKTAPSKPSRESSYVAHSFMASRDALNRSPHGSLRNRTGREADDFVAESSADENTAIVRSSASNNRLNYGAASANGNSIEQEQRIGSDELSVSPQRRKSGSLPAKRMSRHGSIPAMGQDQAQQAGAEHEGFFRSLVEKYGTVELENKGSVARDHLALERTFLAWLRTSLSFASIGIAVTQLFRLNTTIASSDPQSPSMLSAHSKLRSVGKPLGATFLAISILILLLGFHRYFESQHYVIRGKFPASRGTIIIVSAVAAALIIASLIVVVAVAPQAFEK